MRKRIAFVILMGLALVVACSAAGPIPRFELLPQVGPHDGTTAYRVPGTADVIISSAYNPDVHGNLMIQSIRLVPETMFGFVRFADTEYPCRYSVTRQADREDLELEINGERLVILLWGSGEGEYQFQYALSDSLPFMDTSGLPLTDHEQMLMTELSAGQDEDSDPQWRVTRTVIYTGVAQPRENDR